VTALLVVSAVLASAAAQPTGTRIGGFDEFANAQQEDSREVRLIGVRYADCVVKRQPAAASTFVLAQATKLAVRDYRRLLDRLSDGNCLADAAKSFGAVQMRFPQDTMRYTVADALFRAEGPAAPLVVPATLPALAHPSFDEAEYRAAVARGGSKRKREELETQRVRSIGRIFLSSFGECVVRADPASAHSVLRSSVLTPEENNAFVALRPAFGQCLDEGQKLSMNKAILRGTIALNHYRPAQALRQGQ
jgi:hypothetical protein